MGRSPVFGRALSTAALAAALATIPAGATGQERPAPSADAETAERCRGPEHRQFDFWLGSWEVRSASGELLGHNEIRRVASGCGLMENWQGVAGGRGVSINTYDADRERWTQRWVGAGAILWLEGGLEGGKMVLTGTAKRRTPRGAVMDRLTWDPLSDGRVRQMWDVSADGGTSWQRIFEGLYSAARAGDTNHDSHPEPWW